ncbi:hypothetical protein OC845_001402 [Tilletia horrida]|nr:hypothetical protein OC845_001402 [Tilletia horrida]
MLTNSAASSSASTAVPPLQLQLSPHVLTHNIAPLLDLTVLDLPTSTREEVQALVSKTKSSDDNEASTPPTIRHSTLIDLAQQIRIQQPQGIDLQQYTLYALMRDAQIYFAPKPKFVRSPELEKSLAAIRLAQEQAEFNSISSTHNLDPLLPASKRNRYSLFDVSAPTSSSPSSFKPPLLSVQKLTPEQEAAEWAEANRQISAVINIVISMVAVATAAWWAAGSASVIWKTLVSLGLAIVVGIAETVLYARYWRVSAQRATNQSRRMKGFDAGRPPPASALLAFDTNRK